ncbi:hypothetical protein C0989_009956, partial [Termitomyces sp. Mn162]
GRGTLRKAKKSFEFMRELVNDMTNSNPQKRPSMTDIVSRFEDIVNGLDDKQLRSPVLNIDENLPIFSKIKHWTIQWTYKLLGIPAIPNV